ncbi:MAG: hypothetical protein H6707_13620 [Deltaproteobacteria bacterium]|nr:hypothetical protein [Deltaproteobacteria bacterium]
MAVSKNNPAARDNQRLVVYCPETNTEMRLVKRIPGGMFYICDKTGKAYPVTRGCYKDFPHEWVRK